MKETMKLVVLVAIVVVLLAGYAPKAKAETPLRIMNFYDLVDKSVSVKSLGMPLGINLMTQNPITLEISIVDAGSHWHMGFVNYIENGGAVVVGYAENTKTDGSDPSQIGRMIGKYLSTLGEGNRPQDVWTVEDVGNDGIADYYFSTGTLVFDESDNFYYSNDLLFGEDQIRVDLTQLPVYPASGIMTAYLPEMTIAPFVGYDLVDLNNFANYWLDDCNESNSYCDGFDFDDSGTVNFVDYSYFSKVWNPDRTPVPPATTE